MLQEKACKNLSNAIHKAFARVYFLEYKNKLLYQDQDRTPQDMDESEESPHMLLPDMNDEQDYSQEQSPTGSPHRSGMNSQLMIQSRNPNQNNSAFYSRTQKPSPNPHISLMNESISVNRRQPETAQPYGSSSPFRTALKTRTDFERDPEATGFGDAFQKKITVTSHQKSKILSDNTPVVPRHAEMQNYQMTMNPAQMQVMAAQMAGQMANQTQPLPVAKEEAPPEIVRIGDQIRVQFNEQVFDGLKEYAKIEGGKDNMRLAKILEKPDFEYRGVMYSDGIVNKEVKLGTDESFNDKNKSIFKIEVIQDYKFTQQYNDLRVEITTLEPGKFENADEEIEKDNIYQDIKKKYRKELKANASEQNYKAGSKLLYGQTLQLKHMASGLYLTLDTKKLSGQYGCFDLQLAPCNENSRFKLMPSQLKTKQVNEPVSYDDNFIIQNAKDPSDFSLHCDSSDLYIASNQERRRVELPINASHGDTSSTTWSFSKYLLKTPITKDGLGISNSLERDKTISTTTSGEVKKALNTMDAIRLFHREICGYLTVTKRDVLSTLPDYPDYLKKEVAVLSKEKDDLEEDDEELVLDDKDEKNSQGIRISEILIYIEKDESKLDKTNSLWEVQKVGLVVGDDLHTNEKYLIRHVGTGMYLSTTDNIELSLTNQSTNVENEFTFQDEQLSNFAKNKIFDKALVCIQNIDEKYVQTYIDVQKDEYSYIKNRSISTEVPVVCGFKHSKEITKEAFLIEKADDELKLYSQRAYSIYFYLLDSYRYINQWAVIHENDEGDEYDKYDEIMATTTEEHLQEKAQEISSVLDLLIQDLSEKEKDEIIRIQTYYAEQGVVEMLIKLAELNYYKTTRIEDRIHDLLGKAHFRIQAVRNMINDSPGEDEIRAELIADEYLTELNAKILRVIHLLIRFNIDNCNIVTKYDHILYNIKEEMPESEITVFKPRISKILIETYKRATFIHNDKAAVMEVDGGLDFEAITTRLIAGVSSVADKNLVLQMQKWLDMLDMVHYVSEDEHNIYQQVLYTRVIAMFLVKNSRSAFSKKSRAKNENSDTMQGMFQETIKGHKSYQMIAGKFIFATEKSIPLKFGYEHRVTEIPYVTFQKRGGRENAFFLDKNPILEELFRSDAGNENQDNSFTLEEISEHEKILMPYIDYICSVVELYAHLCLDGNVPTNIENVIKSGISFTHAISVLKNEKIHIKLRNSYSFLIRALFLDIEPFISILKNYNRCYFWNSLEFRADQTVTNLDKIKIESVNFNENYDALEKKLSSAKQIRKFIRTTLFTTKGFPEVRKFINEKETLVDIETVNTLISYINNLIEAAIKAIEYGHTDADFVDDCMRFSAFVFLTDHSDYISELSKNRENHEKGSWVIKFLWKANSLKGCKHRVESLIISTCNLLKVICQSRLNRQVLVFMQLFKDFVNSNEVPDVGSYIEAFSRDFEALFRIHNFTIQRSKVPASMKHEILTLQELNLKEKEEEHKRMNVSEYSEEEEEVVEEEQQAIHVIKKEEEDKEQPNKIKNVYLTLHKNVIPLDMYLHKLVFAQAGNKRVQNKAIDILIDNFAQRKYFMDEIVKVELIITDEDTDLYNQYKDHYNRIKKLIGHLIMNDLEYLLLSNFDKEKYKNRVRDTTIIIKNMRSTLKREFNDKTKEVRIQKIQKSQNILRQLGIHVLLINSMKEIYYRHNEHYQMFSAILNFLESFCWENKANQNAMRPYISYLLFLNQWDLDSPAVISEIMKPYNDTPFGDNFFKFIVQRVTERNLFNAHLFNFLAVMASKDTKKHTTKMYILNKLVKQPKLREVMMEIEQAQKKIELIEVFQKKRRTLQDTVLLQEKEFLDAHISLINLYAK